MSETRSNGVSFSYGGTGDEATRIVLRRCPRATSSVARLSQSNAATPRARGHGRRRRQARDRGLDEDERALPLTAPRTCPPGRGGCQHFGPAESTERSRVDRSGRGRACPGPSHTTGRAGPHPAVRSACPETAEGLGESLQALSRPVGVWQGAGENGGAGDAPVALGRCGPFAGVSPGDPELL